MQTQKQNTTTSSSPMGTYDVLQLKLQELFNSLNDVSIKLAGAKDRVFKVEKELKEVKKALDVAQKDYKKVKEAQIVGLQTFVYSSNLKTTLEMSYRDTKIALLTATKTMNDFIKQKDQLVQEYGQVEAKMKDFDNVLQFGKH